MKVSEIGELGLVDAVTALIERRQPKADHPALLLGAGEDDAAAWEAPAAVHVATTDTLTEGVDFILGTASWRELGWKALAVNLSDLAAMGAIPGYALVTMGLPVDTEVEGVLAYYEGMLDLADSFGVTLVGGDFGAAGEVSLTVALCGQARDGDGGRMLRRDAARPGDVVAVTGQLGASAAGLRMLLEAISLPPAVEADLRQAHLRPWPRVDEGGALLRAGVRAAMDVSDGLVVDLERLCRASRVGARVRIERVPVHPATSAAFPADALHLALSGGEDFELLFAAPPSVVAQAAELTSTRITVIGEVVEGSGGVSLLDEAGQPCPVPGRGWEHFRPA